MFLKNENQKLISINAGNICFFYLMSCFRHLCKIVKRQRLYIKGPCSCLQAYWVYEVSTHILQANRAYQVSSHILQATRVSSYILQANQAYQASSHISEHCNIISQLFYYLLFVLYYFILALANHFSIYHVCCNTCYFTLFMYILFILLV